MSLRDVLGALRITDVARLGPARGLPAPPPAGAYVPDADPRHALDLARRAGHPEQRVEALARTLRALDPAARRAVVDPLGRLAPSGGHDDAPRVRALELGGARARQTDGTTCCSAVLGLLAAAGDPVLALWLTTGLRPGGTTPPRSTLAQSTARFRALQQAVKRRTNARSLGPLPWPAALGTPPWGAARVARHADVRFVERTVAGGEDADGGPVLRAALVAAARGVPVPLFTGGDLAHGIATAVPRHVVLLTRADPQARRCTVYEPSSGTLHDLPAAALHEAVRVPVARRALGGWPHVCWALLPAGRAGESARPDAGWA
ncbi:hypothetical protein GJV82_08370 [Cellulosimicrobium sp. BIT-GX5]|uniref:Uncharacterized protein n=1 Tax=Cellulosimicrobium composti TaxID=2672572 RepID=A0A6N7ZI08_9MICO|nr:hypothetical protein [Cellulosimicrobium composti]MTG88959.1 hypothetical protein [Cellulosimicrobium composti]